uniref:Transmembrane protein n=1 Tax=Haemonchus contortus TaxID=6289 RepID=A0A7I4Z5N0_HAECO
MVGEFALTMGVLATSVCADVMYAIGLKKKELAALDALNTTTAVEEESIKSGTETLVSSPGIYSPAVLLDKTSLVDTRRNPGKYPTVKIKTFIERLGRREDFELKPTGTSDTSKHAGMDSMIEKEKSSRSSVLVEL